MFRLMLLMAMGLGALYMMHLLAQDYNKIRQPVAAAARALSSASASVSAGAKTTRGKRDSAALATSSNATPPALTNSNQHLSATQPITNTSLHIDWKLILSRDPFECLQSLICQLMAGAERRSAEAAIVLNFLEFTVYRAPVKIKYAFDRGLALRGHTARCYDEYPFCVYSAKTMLRMLKWFANTPYVEADASAS